MPINRTMQENWGREIYRIAGFVTTGMRVGSELRGAFEAYAMACGMSPALCGRSTDADLIGVYLVGKRDPQAATRTVRKVEERLRGLAPAGPLEDPLYPPPSYGAPEPLPEPWSPAPAPRAPDPLPEPPAPAPETVTATVREFIKAEIKTGVLTPLQLVIDQLDKDVTNRLNAAHGRVHDAIDGLMGEVENVAQKAVAEALKAMTPTVIDVTRPDEPAPVSLGMVHFKTPQIIAALKAGVNVYLHGPAGSGKTTAGRKVAEAFGVPFYFAAKVESEYQLLGFQDARGQTVRTQFREAYEHGGTFLFDEMDASSPSAVVALNAALANGVCPFPDGIVKRHKDFLCLGAGNTKLSGASRQYAGRNQLDGASVDRFAFIEFPYDDQLERALATDQRWCAYVQRVRKEVADRGLSHLVTPRATYDGCKLLEAGLEWETVAGMCVYKGLDADTVAQIERAVGKGA